MAVYECTVACAWPPDAALRYMADFSNSEAWDPGVAKARRASEGPVAVGSAFDLDVRTRGEKSMSMRYVVTALTDASVTLMSTTPRLMSRDTVTVAPDGSGSRMTYRAELRLRGVLAPLTPLIKLPLKRIGDRARDSLVAILSGPVPAA